MHWYLEWSLIKCKIFVEEFDNDIHPISYVYITGQIFLLPNMGIRPPKISFSLIFLFLLFFLLQTVTICNLFIQESISHAKDSIHSFICNHLSSAGMQGGWSQSQLTFGEGQGSPRTSCQFFISCCAKKLLFIIQCVFSKHVQNVLYVVLSPFGSWVSVSSKVPLYDPGW